MIVSIVIHRSIWIIEPISRRHQMILWTHRIISPSDPNNNDYIYELLRYTQFWSIMNKDLYFYIRNIVKEKNLYNKMTELLTGFT
jgi:hypothetical protein